MKKVVLVVPWNYLAIANMVRASLIKTHSITIVPVDNLDLTKTHDVNSIKSSVREQSPDIIVFLTTYDIETQKNVVAGLRKVFYFTQQVEYIYTLPTAKYTTTLQRKQAAELILQELRVILEK